MSMFKKCLWIEIQENAFKCLFGVHQIYLTSKRLGEWVNLTSDLLLILGPRFANNWGRRSLGLNHWLNWEFYQRSFYKSLVSDLTDGILLPKSVCLKLPNGILEHGAVKWTTGWPWGIFLEEVGSTLNIASALPTDRQLWGHPSSIPTRAVCSPELLNCGYILLKEWRANLCYR